MYDYPLPSAVILFAAVSASVRACVCVVCKRETDRQIETEGEREFPSQLVQKKNSFCFMGFCLFVVVGFIVFFVC